MKTVKYQFLIKLGIFIVYPILIIPIALSILLILGCSWLLIPFSIVKIDESGSYSFKFPWSDSSKTDH